MIDYFYRALKKIPELGSTITSDFFKVMRISIILLFYFGISCNGNSQPSSKGTAESSDYIETNKYFDQSIMNDAKVDGVIYKKENGKYYKKVFSGSVKVSWFGAKGDGTNDDTKSLQMAINYCIKSHSDLEIDGKCLISSSIFIDRKVDSEEFDNYFTIFSNSGGGFITNKAISLFSSSLRFQGAPVSQLIKFNNISFNNNNRNNETYVLDGSKFLRTQFNACSFVKIRLLNARNYIQSIYLFNCNIRRWLGDFVKSTERTYDFKMIGCLAEAGYNCLNINEPYGCSIIGTTIEGMFGTAITFNKAEGLTITGNYFEGNKLGDIINSSQTAVSNGVAVIGNFFYNTNKNDNKFSIVWGNVKGGLSSANSSLSNLHYLSPESHVSVNDVAKELLVNENQSLQDGETFLLKNLSSPRLILNQKCYFIRNKNIVNFWGEITFPVNNNNEDVVLNGFPFFSSNSGNFLTGYSTYSSKSNQVYLNNISGSSNIGLYSTSSKRLKNNDLSGSTVRIVGSYYIKN